MNVVTTPGERGADERLGVAVALGGVDDVEAGRQRVVEQPAHGGRLGALETDLGAAEAEHADVEPGPAERAPDHRRALARLRRRGAVPGSRRRATAPVPTA